MMVSKEEEKQNLLWKAISQLQLPDRSAKAKIRRDSFRNTAHVTCKRRRM